MFNRDPAVLPEPIYSDGYPIGPFDEVYPDPDETIFDGHEGNKYDSNSMHNAMKISFVKLRSIISTLYKMCLAVNETGNILVFANNLYAAIYKQFICGNIQTNYRMSRLSGA